MSREHQWKSVRCPEANTFAEECSECGATRTTTCEQDGEVITHYFMPEDRAPCDETDDEDDADFMGVTP